MSRCPERRIGSESIKKRLALLPKTYISCKDICTSKEDFAEVLAYWQYKLILSKY